MCGTGVPGYVLWGRVGTSPNQPARCHLEWGEVNLERSWSWLVNSSLSPGDPLPSASHQGSLREADLVTPLFCSHLFHAPLGLRRHLDSAATACVQGLSWADPLAPLLAWILPSAHLHPLDPRTCFSY